MISALPPKAKITALVCSGRSRPKLPMPCRNSKFSHGQASWLAMITPTRNPTTPQKVVAMTPAADDPVHVFAMVRDLGFADAAQHHDERDGSGQHHSRSR